MEPQLYEYLMLILETPYTEISEVSTYPSKKVDSIQISANGLSYIIHKSVFDLAQELNKIKDVSLDLYTSTLESIKNFATEVADQAEFNVTYDG